MGVCGVCGGPGLIFGPDPVGTYERREDTGSLWGHCCLWDNVDDILACGNQCRYGRRDDARGRSAVTLSQLWGVISRRHADRDRPSAQRQGEAVYLLTNENRVMIVRAHGASSYFSCSFPEVLLFFIGMY